LNHDYILLQLFVELWSTSHTTTFIFTLLLFLHSCLCYGFVNTNVPLPDSVLWVTVVLECHSAVSPLQAAEASVLGKLPYLSHSLGWRSLARHWLVVDWTRSGILVQYKSANLIPETLSLHDKWKISTVLFILQTQSGDSGLYKC
jgi:hypothetical protein